jgi:peptidyl-prolyl cis-trans isomerase A (cyclophilin A)
MIMRASLTALLPLALLAACSQAPMKPAQAAAATPPQVCPPPAAPVSVPPPVPVVQEVPVDKDHREVLIQTNYGDITVQLDAKRAPLSANDFLAYVNEHYYDGAAFYRVIPGFVIQAGEFSPAFDYHKPNHPDIANESGNGLANQRGSIAMAREDDPHSANSVFYINVGDNSRRLGPRPDRWGYAVFGQVVAGMDVADKIAAVQTHTVVLSDKDHSTFQDVPAEPVKILKVSLLPLPVSSKP